VTEELCKVIYFFGEGKTDLGEGPEPAPPNTGVLPILVHTLCGRAVAIHAVRRRFAHLQGKGLWQKVRFAKRQALGRSAGAVFVVDSEGDLPVLQTKTAQLHKGRESTAPDFPMAVGVAQPCIESWLLADPSAVQSAMSMSTSPNVPDEPERLPAPSDRNSDDPKRALAKACGSRHNDLSAQQKWDIAKAMNDMHLVRGRCPRSFAPFADEVDRQIRPLF